MKKHTTMKTILTTIFALGALVSVSTIKADNANCGGNWGGRSDDFEQVIVLDGTANVSTNAIGVASLRNDDDCWTNTTTVKVKVAGLDAADYNVSVTDVTGTNAYDLGTFTVSTNFPCDFDDADDYVWSAGTNSVTISTNITTFGGGKFDLPAGLDPTNVAYIYIFDTNGIVDFTGDFTSLTNIAAVFYEQNVAVTPGTATNAAGKGKIVLSYKNGKTSSSFLLNCTNLPPKQNLSLNANGVKSTSTTTTPKGAVTVKTLPHTKLADLQILEAKDKKGKVVFSVQF